MAADPRSRLERLVAEELTRPAPEPARALSDAIRARHGDAVAAILFYGSCLRKRTAEGVFDFYVLVDDYRSAFPSRWLAWANTVVPPSVFYLEHETTTGTLRTKYAVLSRREFARAVAPGYLHSTIWARFAQPALLVYARDAEARREVVACAAQAAVTLVQRLAPFLPARGRSQRFSLGAFWQEAFRRTYGAEIRSESAETIRSLYEADASRYDAVAVEAFGVLLERGWLEELSVHGSAVALVSPPGRRRAARWRWHATRLVGKGLYFLRLLKTAFTFGDWLPYALWKLERHTGERVVPTERQRRHPLIFGWPVLFRLLAGKQLR